MGVPNDSTDSSQEKLLTYNVDAQNQNYDAQIIVSFFQNILICVSRMDPIFAAAATTKVRGDKSDRCLQFWEEIHCTSVANPPAGAIWETEVGPKCRNSGRAHW
jgi:hypothetical protein